MKDLARGWQSTFQEPKINQCTAMPLFCLLIKGTKNVPNPCGHIQMIEYIAFRYLRICLRQFGRPHDLGIIYETIDTFQLKKNNLGKQNYKAYKLPRWHNQIIWSMKCGDHSWSLGMHMQLPSMVTKRRHHHHPSWCLKFNNYLVPDW